MSRKMNQCARRYTQLGHTLVLDKARDLLDQVGVAKLWRRIIASFCGVDEYRVNANDI